MKSVSQRKKEERQRKRDAGLVPLEVWVPKEMVLEVRKYVASLLDTAQNSATFKNPNIPVPHQ